MVALLNTLTSTPNNAIVMVQGHFSLLYWPAGSDLAIGSLCSGSDGAGLSFVNVNGLSADFDGGIIDAFFSIGVCSGLSFIV